ncbi:MAG: hypothetical protein ACE3JN_07120 [Ectobacillus sp.]
MDERRRLLREKRLGPARGKRPPVVEKQQSSLTAPIFYSDFPPLHRAYTYTKKC